jgi:hypothetical protein
MSMIWKTIFVVFIAFAGMFSPVPALSQSEPEVESPTDKVCLVRGSMEEMRGAQGVRIIVDRDDTATFVARGFRDVSCSGFTTSFQKASDHMCQLSALKNQHVENDFLALHGVTPTELCALSR